MQIRKQFINHLDKVAEWMLQQPRFRKELSAAGSEQHPCICGSEEAGTKIYIYIFSIEYYWYRINSNLSTSGPFLQGAIFLTITPKDDVGMFTCIFHWGKCPSLKCY